MPPDRVRAPAASRLGVGDRPAATPAPGPEPGPAPAARFTLTSARSAETLVVVLMIFAIETVGFHLLLSLWRPLAAWVMTLVNLLTLGWLVADFRDLGRTAVEVSAEGVEMKIGRRLTVCVPHGAIERACVPSPAERAELRGTFLDATRPATPNLLIAFGEPVTAVLLGSIRRPVRMLALCVDDPPGAAAALSARAPTPESGGTEGTGRAGGAAHR